MTKSHILCLPLKERFGNQCQNLKYIVFHWKRVPETNAKISYTLSSTERVFRKPVTKSHIRFSIEREFRKPIPDSHILCLPLKERFGNQCQILIHFVFHWKSVSETNAKISYTLTFLLMNVFIALKGSHFWFLFVSHWKSDSETSAKISYTLYSTERAFRKPMPDSHILCLPLKERFGNQCQNLIYFVFHWMCVPETNDKISFSLSSIERGFQKPMPKSHLLVFHWKWVPETNAKISYTLSSTETEFRKPVPNSHILCLHWKSVPKTNDNISYTLSATESAFWKPVPKSHILCLPLKEFSGNQCQKSHILCLLLKEYSGNQWQNLIYVVFHWKRVPETNARLSYTLSSIVRAFRKPVQNHHILCLSFKERFGNQCQNLIYFVSHWKSVSETSAKFSYTLSSTERAFRKHMPDSHILCLPLKERFGNQCQNRKFHWMCVPETNDKISFSLSSIERGFRNQCQSLIYLSSIESEFRKPMPKSHILCLPLKESSGNQCQTLIYFVSIERVFRKPMTKSHILCFLLKVRFGNQCQNLKYFVFHWKRVLETNAKISITLSSIERVFRKPVTKSHILYLTLKERFGNQCQNLIYFVFHWKSVPETNAKISYTLSSTESVFRKPMPKSQILCLPLKESSGNQCQNLIYFIFHWKRVPETNAKISYTLSSIEREFRKPMPKSHILCLPLKESSENQCQNLIYCVFHWKSVPETNDKTSYTLSSIEREFRKPMPKSHILCLSLKVRCGNQCQNLIYFLFHWESVPETNDKISYTLSSIERAFRKPMIKKSMSKSHNLCLPLKECSGKWWQNLQPVTQSVLWAAAWQNHQNDMCAQRRLRPVWSESSVSSWRNLGSLTTHWAHSEDSDQTGRIHRLIWVFALRASHFVGLSWGGWIIVIK